MTVGGVPEGYGRPEIVGDYAGVSKPYKARDYSPREHFIGDGEPRGVDQGDTNVSLETLLEVHGQGYYSALDAGDQCDGVFQQLERKQSSRR